MFLTISCVSESLHLSELQGTNRYFQRVAVEFGVEVTFADCTKPEELKAHLKPNTKVSEGECPCATLCSQNESALVVFVFNISSGEPPLSVSHPAVSSCLLPVPTS